jgi:hypothetical protein
MSLAIDYAHAFEQTRPSRRLKAAARYAVVLGVWTALLLVRPRLALRIFRERRQDSPIPRLRR